MALSREDGYPTKHVKIILGRLSGSNREAVELELQDTWRELCEQTLCWRETIRHTITSDITEFPLSTPEPADIHEVISGSLNERPILFWSGDRAFPTNRVYHIVDASNPKVLRFGENDNGELLLLVALRPLDDVDADPNIYIPTDLQNRFFSAILDGALGRLYSTPDKPYSQLTLGNYYLKRFRAHLTRVRRNIRGGNTFATVTPWVFWGQGISRRRGRRVF